MFHNRLTEILGSQNVKTSEPMSAHTTFRVGGPADFFLTPRTESALLDTLRFVKEQEIPFLIIGNGSNLIVRDGGIRGAVIRLGREISGIRIAGNELTAGAGQMLSSVAGSAAEAGLSGLEFAGGIPGSVGGALYMNAGAYDGEIRDVVVSARVCELNTLKTKSIETKDMALAYRHSVFQNGELLVLEATFALSYGDRDAIRAKIHDFAERRNEKQPMKDPSAGSFFKRPEGAFAGKLIEDAGLKGFAVGGVMVSEKHAGFLINTGNATASDVLTVMQIVQKKVKETSGYELLPEPRLVGEG
ncbi:MAG: UDP-N-acetylmuramate dehydrogenase [Clostridiales Family XIII bacterium]|nr:UDP-N-acetylmuramate dehydrogenase [Clostridiales Family XIII bacterium]